MASEPRAKRVVFKVYGAQAQRWVKKRISEMDSIEVIYNGKMIPLSSAPDWLVRQNIEIGFKKFVDENGGAAERAIYHDMRVTANATLGRELFEGYGNGS